MNEKEFKNKLVEWIVLNVDESDVPGDEGNGEGLVYNLVQLAINGKDYKRYDYTESVSALLLKHFTIK